MNQRTINKVVTIEGKALHSGELVRLVLKPLNANQGIIFKRSDLKNNNIIPASYMNVSSTTLCTEIGNDSDVKISTIEHLMSAFFFLGIDNILVEVNSSELPAVDGSAYGFMTSIMKAGIKDLDTPKKILEILRPVHIKNEKWELSIVPSNQFIVNSTIDFPHKCIGVQKYTYKYNEYPDSCDISKAKTFGFLKDVEFLHKNGLGLGATYKNTNILTQDSLLEMCSLVYKDEFVKHKILDLCGDLYLCGYFIKGEINAFKSGHLANNMLLKTIFSDKENYNVKSDIKTIIYSDHKGENSRIFTY